MVITEIMIGFAPMTRMRAFILAEVLFIVMIVAGVFFYMNRDDDVAESSRYIYATCMTNSALS